MVKKSDYPSLTRHVAQLTPSDTQRTITADFGADLNDQLSPHERYFPGLAITALVMLSAGFLWQRYGTPLSLSALLIGFALNFLRGERRLYAGLDLAMGPLLRIGIISAGANITVSQLQGLGALSFVGIVIILVLTLLTGMGVSRFLGFDGKFGMLAGAAVAICGASAALAVSTMLGGEAKDRTHLPVVLVGISVMSACAMFFYPLLAHALALGERQAGFFLGASIHDVAQSVSAGYSVGIEAGQTATIVKLTRVALLAPTLLVLSSLVVRTPQRGRIQLPWFLAGFVIVVLMNSTGLIAPELGHVVATSGTVLVATAVAAAGVRAPLRLMLQNGIRPMLPIAIASLVSATLSILFAIFLVAK